MAEHIDSDFRGAEHSEQMGKGMQDSRGDFELSRQFDNLGAGLSGNVFWSAFVSLFDTGQDNQRFVHPRHWVIVLLIDLGAPLGGDGTAEAVGVHVTVQQFLSQSY